MSGEFIKKDSLNKKSAYIIGCIIGLLTTIATMLLFSAILLFFNIDRAYATPFATISLSLGCYIASHITAKKTGEKGYLTGFLIGIIVFVIITLLSMIMGNNLSINTLFRFLIITLSSIVGGIAGVNKKHNRKYI